MLHCIRSKVYTVSGSKNSTLPLTYVINSIDLIKELWPLFRTIIHFYSPLLRIIWYDTYIKMKNPADIISPALYPAPLSSIPIFVPVNIPYNKIGKAIMIGVSNKIFPITSKACKQSSSN